MFRNLLAAIVLAALAVPAAAGEIRSSVDAGKLPKSRQTGAGLYLTATDAARALAADPGIVFIDVRTRAEFSFVGHPDPVDQNIPLAFFTDRFVPERGVYAYDMNQNFLNDVASLMIREGKGKDDPVFVICRSGARSAAAVNLLAKAGYTRAYTVVDGFEGGHDKATGHRTVNGWRNAGLPWGYRIAPAVAYRPAE